MRAVELRFACPDDGPAIQAIYGPIVTDTAISFDTDVPEVDEIADRMAAKWPRHPWLVAEDSRRIVGYAYAGPFSTRPAGAWSTEVTVYVHPDARRRHVGRALYTALFELLRLQGYLQVFAGIVLPNPASVALHGSLGFVPIGRYTNVGWKRGSWHDVTLWQRPLSTIDGQPAPLRRLDQLTQEEVAGALASDTGRFSPVGRPDREAAV